jgi:hypothetical protein
MRTWVKMTLFFSSFSPLFFIVFIQNIKFEDFLKITFKLFQFSQIFQSNSIAILMLILFLLPNVVLFFLISRCKQFSPERKQISQVTYKNSDILNYIATYLIPFFSFKTDKLSDFIAFILLLAILSLVYINANVFYINPVLIMCGYNVYQVNEQSVLITKGKPATGNSMNFYKIENNVYLGVEIRGNN